jgi:hypothetical protein
MPAECRSVLKACLAQFVLLDTCGAPVTGAASKLTTKGFVKVAATAQVEDGQETILKNACGELCINEKDCDQFKRYDLEMEFCQIDPEGLTVVSNSRALVDGAGNTKGFAHGETTDCGSFSLELWTRVTPQTCVTPGNPEWFYFAIPWVYNGMIGDVTFEDGPLTMTVKAHTKGAGALWGRGPSCVLPDESPALTTDHLLGYITDIQPPDPVCGLQALSAAELVCA